MRMDGGLERRERREKVGKRGNEGGGPTPDFRGFFLPGYSADVVTCDACSGEGRCGCAFHSADDQRCPYCRGVGLRRVAVGEGALKGRV